MLQESVPRPRFADPVLPPAEGLEGDDEYLDELVALMCGLEDLRERMAAAHDSGQSAAALALGEVLLKQMVEFAERSCPFAPGQDRDGAEARVRDFYATLPPLREQVPDPSAVRAAAGRSFAALYDAVFAYFVLFTNRFSTSWAARPWVEVAAMFVVDLRRLAPDPGRGPDARSKISART